MASLRRSSPAGFRVSLRHRTRSTSRRIRFVAAKNAAHYERYPDDAEQARRIAAYLAAKEVLLPSGAPLTVEAFQSLGDCLGMSSGSHDLHYLIEDAFDGDVISDDFAYRDQSALTFAGRPLYALLHEACYAQEAATGWAAQRTRAHPRCPTRRGSRPTRYRQQPQSTSTTCTCHSNSRSRRQRRSGTCGAG